ncbi:MAG: hypothetical protein U0517_00385 [Candidatus Andersenbacteria bacterium]
MKRTLLVLAFVVVSALALTKTVNAAAVETIEIDLEQQAPDSAGQLAEKTHDANQTQFMYLIGLASVGLLGIAGVVRDVHKDRA